MALLYYRGSVILAHFEIIPILAYINLTDPSQNNNNIKFKPLKVDSNLLRKKNEIVPWQSYATFCASKI